KMPANQGSKSRGAGNIPRNKAATKRAARGGTVGTTGVGICSARNRFYTCESGIKVGPVPVLAMALLFIATVFMLHIWGKYARS
ncbi:Protein transport protein Sec61 subunit beta, partial [Cryptotermes secundus]